MLIETEDGDLVANAADGAGMIILKEPRKCKCGRMAAFLVNRDGKTRCVSCDSDYQQEKLARGTDQI